MPNLDTHLPDLRARTLTAAAVQNDGSLDLEEKAALLTAVCMRENSPKPEVKTGFRLIAGSDAQQVVWAGGEQLGGMPDGDLQYIKFEVLTNPNLDPIIFSSPFGHMLGNQSTEDMPWVGTVLEVTCKEGETLERDFVINIPQQTVADILVRITYTIIE